MKLKSIKIKQNPFYYNYPFTKKDLHRPRINKCKRFFLWFLPTFVQLSDGYLFQYKTLNNRIYLMDAKQILKQQEVT